MIQLSEHEQQQVDTAVTNNCVCTEMDCVHSKSFRRGITFALQHLLPGRMERLLQAFGDWLWRNYKQVDAQVWKERWTTTDTVYTLYQVIEKYLQYLETLKQKEDGDH